MDFSEIKNKSEREILELLATEKKALHGLTLEARNRTLKQVHKVKLARRTIARLEMKRQALIKARG
ncbi:MAG: 50S ribosomal protein L29 [Candidatus Magasanikbacteria bacterium]|nr:50S ribosomal protein L29 [Candidatus Magasanikbacteria bacterium]